jgi:hypothetical protein
MNGRLNSNSDSNSNSNFELQLQQQFELKGSSGDWRWQARNLWHRRPRGERGACHFTVPERGGVAGALGVT